MKRKKEILFYNNNNNNAGFSPSFKRNSKYDNIEMIPHSKISEDINPLSSIKC